MLLLIPGVWSVLLWKMKRHTRNAQSMCAVSNKKAKECVSYRNSNFVYKYTKEKCRSKNTIGNGCLATAMEAKKQLPLNLDIHIVLFGGFPNTPVSEDVHAEVRWLSKNSLVPEEFYLHATAFQLRCHICTFCSWSSLSAPLSPTDTGPTDMNPFISLHCSLFNHSPPLQATRMKLTECNSQRQRLRFLCEPAL